MSSHLAHPRSALLPSLCFDIVAQPLNSAPRVQLICNHDMGLVSINDLEIPTLYAVPFILFRALNKTQTQLQICAAQIEYPK